MNTRTLVRRLAPLLPTALRVLRLLLLLWVLAHQLCGDALADSTVYGNPTVWAEPDAAGQLLDASIDVLDLVLQPCSNSSAAYVEVDETLTLSSPIVVDVGAGTWCSATLEVSGGQVLIEQNGSPVWVDLEGLEVELDTSPFQTSADLVIRVR